MAPSSIQTPPPGQPAVARRQIPGPPGPPWLGQLPAFLRSKFFPRKMLEWAEKYNGVYGMEIVGKKYLVVTEPSLLPEIVGRGSRGLPKSDGYAMWDPMLSRHPGVQGMFTVSENNDTWRMVRRAYGPAMGTASLSRHFPTVLRCTSKLGHYLEAAGAGGRTSLEVTQLLKSLTLDTLGEVAFKFDLGCLERPGDAALPLHIERSVHECGERGRGVGRRLLPWLYDNERQEGEAAMAAVHHTVEDLWRELKARGSPADDDTSLGAQFLRLVDPAKGAAALSEEQMLAEVATVLVAGYETTANALTWLLFALCAHPAAAAKLEEELRTAGLMPEPVFAASDGAAVATTAAAVAATTASSYSSGTAAGPPDPTADALLSLPGGYDTLSSLPYLDAYIREGLRVFSTTPNGQIKQVPKDGPPVRVGPYEVDPGTVVWAPMWALHLSSLIWEQPLEFRPERWIGQDPRSGAALSASRCPVSAAAGAIRTAAGAVTDAVILPPGADVSNSNSGGDGDRGGAATASGGRSDKAIRYMPFGDGSRNCVGMHLAMLQLKVALSYIVSRFHVRLDEQRMGGVAGALDRHRVNLTLEVDGGMWLLLEPRRQ